MAAYDRDLREDLAKRGPLAIPGWPANAAGVLTNNGSGVLTWGAGGGGGGMAIGDAVTSGTAGSLLFVGTGGVLAQNNTALFWNNTSSRLGVGVAAPAEAVDVAGTVQSTGLKMTTTPTSGHVLTSDAAGVGTWQAIPAGVLTVGTTSVASGTAGRVMFQGSGNVLQQSANLFWDNGANRLGLGTATPAQALDVVGTAQMTGFRLSTSPTNGHVLTSDASGVGTWQAPSGGGASIGGAVTGGTQYSVLFVDPAATLAQDNNGLKFNPTTDTLTVGGSGALAVVNVTSSAATDVVLQANNTNNASATANAYLVTSTAAGGGDPFFYMAASGVINWGIGIDRSDGATGILKFDSSASQPVPGTNTSMQLAHTGAEVLRVSRNTDAGNHVLMRNTDSGTSASSGFYLNNGTGSGYFVLYGTGTVDSAYAGANDVLIGSTLGRTSLFTAVNEPIEFWVNNTVQAAQVLSTEFVINQAGANYNLRVEGDTDPNLFVTVASTDNVGIGTATPAAKLDIVGGTVTNTDLALRVEGTLAGAANYGSRFIFTPNGTGSGQYGVFASLSGGPASSNSQTYAAMLANTSTTGAGTLNPLTGGDAFGANIGYWGQADGAAPSNIGGLNRAFYGTQSTGVWGQVGDPALSENGYAVDSFNTGVVGTVVPTKHSGSTTEKHLGVFGAAAGGDTNVGGYFTLAGGTPTLTSAALMADNAATSSAILVARDNGTAVLTVADGGVLTVAPGGTTKLSVNGTGVGFFAVAAVAQQASGANLTNNVSSGGTDDTIADIADLTVYANAAADIRNNIYQLARKLKQVNDALRAYGLLT